VFLTMVVSPVNLQITDGAAAVLLMTRREALRRGLPILGIFRSFAAVGVDPAIMGVGPAVAIPAAVEKVSGLYAWGGSFALVSWDAIFRFVKPILLRLCVCERNQCLRWCGVEVTFRYYSGTILQGSFCAGLNKRLLS
jgi:hypothetical protein